MSKSKKPSGIIKPRGGRLIVPPAHRKRPVRDPGQVGPISGTKDAEAANASDAPAAPTEQKLKPLFENVEADSPFGELCYVVAQGAANEAHDRNLSPWQACTAMANAVAIIMSSFPEMPDEAVTGRMDDLTTIMKTRFAQITTDGTS